MLEYAAFIEKQRLCIIGLQSTPFGPVPFSVNSEISEQVPNGAIDLSEQQTPSVENALKSAKGSVVNQLEKQKIKVGAQQMIIRSRAGDQNAMGTLTMIAQNAKKGSPRAIYAFECCKIYIKSNPMILTTEGFEIKKPETYRHSAILVKTEPKVVIGDDFGWDWNPVRAVRKAIRKVASLGKKAHIPGSSSLDTVIDITDGGNVLKAIKRGAKGEVKTGIEAAVIAAPIAATFPGVGTGAAAALTMAAEIGQGHSIKNAILVTARNSVPGGAIGKTAFDVGAGLASGRRIDHAVIDAARKAIPGDIAKAAFDEGIKAMKGERINPNKVINHLLKNTVPGVSEERYAAAVTGLITGTESRNAAIMLADGKKIDINVLGMAKAAQHDAHKYFDYGYRNSGDSKIVLDAGKKIKDPNNLKALKVGYVLGMAKRIQMVKDGAPINVLSDVVAWELGE
jgi:hypothetical protein